jgi:thimet oligopeptidase
MISRLKAGIGYAAASALLCCIPVSALPAGARALIPLQDAAGIGKTCRRTLAEVRKGAAALERSAPKDALAGWDRLQIAMEDAQGPAELFANVSPDKKTRAAGDACGLKFTALNTELQQNAKIYALIRQVKPADDVARKLKQDIVEAFEDTGVALPPGKRARMRAIVQRIEELRQAFARNIRDNKTRLAFSPEEMKGLPESYLAARRRDDKGNYLLGFEYPEFEPFMSNAENGDARRRYLIAFNNRGTPQNLELLAEASRLRREMAALYGLRSYAAFVTRRRMVGNPETVLRFLAEVRAKVREVEAKELAELRAFKAGRLGIGAEQARIERWDISYYQEQLKKARYNVDQEQLRKYFPTDASVAWVLGISSELYGVRFVQATVPVWDPSVRYLDVLDGDSGKIIGGIYLDLFPREGKFSHAAAFGVRSASVAAGRTPISALVANLDAGGLNQRELETLLHEFGHVLHGVLSRTRYASQGGTNVERDFVEAPSQMYEEWARAREPLGLFRRYCAACPEVDAALVARLHSARSFGQGIQYARQQLYASYDMALAGEKEVDPMKTWIEMESDTPTGYLPGTQFPGTFAHVIGGYAAGYYGYMWSEVLALDMLSVYGKNLMNPAVGRRFRDLVLSQGGQRPAAELVRSFLGRDPSPQAFFDEITGRRGN